MAVSIRCPFVYARAADVYPRAEFVRSPTHDAAPTHSDGLRHSSVVAKAAQPLHRDSEHRGRGAGVDKERLPTIGGRRRQSDPNERLLGGRHGQFLAPVSDAPASVGRTDRGFLRCGDRTPTAAASRSYLWSRKWIHR